MQVNDFVEFFSGDAKVSAALRNALASICCMGHWGTKQNTICFVRLDTQELLWTFCWMQGARPLISVLKVDFCRGPTQPNRCLYNATSKSHG